MVGVDRLQALPTSHGASTASQIGTTLLHWIHWPQAPATFLIAILISWISLLFGFHHKGRPFGSRRAAADAIEIIAATAIIAAVLSVFVPRLPLSMGIFIPALLCGAVLKEEEGEQELRAAQPELAAIITLGISYLLNRLREQMSGDCADWCEQETEHLRSWDEQHREDKLASLSNFELAAGRVRSMLGRRLPGDLRTRVQEHYSEVDPAVNAARRYHSEGNYKGFSEEYNRVEDALYLLLEYAYNWKYTNINVPAASKPPERDKVDERSQRLRPSCRSRAARSGNRDSPGSGGRVSCRAGISLTLLGKISLIGHQLRIQPGIQRHAHSRQSAQSQVAVTGQDLRNSARCNPKRPRKIGPVHALLLHGPRDGCGQVAWQPCQLAIQGLTFLAAPRHQAFRHGRTPLFRAASCASVARLSSALNASGRTLIRRGRSPGFATISRRR